MFSNAQVSWIKQYTDMAMLEILTKTHTNGQRITGTDYLNNAFIIIFFPAIWFTHDILSIEINQQADCITTACLLREMLKFSLLSHKN